MINSASYGLCNPAFTNDLRDMNRRMPMGVPTFGYPNFGYPSFGYGGIGYGMGNRDAITLQGPLGYDQYKGATDQAQDKKDKSFWKGLATAALVTGGLILGGRTKIGQKVIGAVKPFISKLAKSIKPVLQTVGTAVAGFAKKAVGFFKGLFK